MRTLAELRKRLTEVVEEMQDLSDAGFDDESRSVFDELKSEAAQIRDDIDRLESIAEARRTAPLPDLGTTTIAPTPDIRMGDAPEDRPFASFGEQLRAVHRAGIGVAVDPRLRDERAVSGHSEGVPSDGGFLVQSDFAAGIFQIAHDGSQFLQRCSSTPVSGNGLTINVVDETTRASGARFGGVLAYWKPEAGTATAQKVKLAQVELKLRKLIASSYATDELLEDTSALGPLMARAFAEEIQFMIDDALIRGDGAAMPLGITKAACFIEQAEETGQTADTIVYENLVNMWSRLHARSQPKSVWMINQNCLPQLMLMTMAVGTAGVPVYLPPGGASGAPYGTIFGRPVLVTEFSAGLGDEYDVMLGDWSQYQVITKGGLKSDVSAHVKFLEDEMTFRFTYRIDGQPLWKSALTPFKGTAETQGPFIGLAERA